MAERRAGHHFAAIGVILLAPRADQAYAAAKGFMVGTAIGGPCRK
jgi:hypothetical protein